MFLQRINETTELKHFVSMNEAIYILKENTETISEGKREKLFHKKTVKMLILKSPSGGRD